MTDLFPCKQMPTTDPYRDGYDLAMKNDSYKCPECQAFVSGGDTSCWACGEDDIKAVREERG